MPQRFVRAVSVLPAGPPPLTDHSATQSSPRAASNGIYPTSDEYLRQVDALMAQTVEDLDRLWSEHLGRTRLDILGDLHVPTLVDRLLSGGGKRIRPTMAYLGWLAAAPAGRPAHDHHDVVRVGAALEMLHVFALVHDDVMDESATRRGHPTIHRQARGRHIDSAAAGDAVRFGDSVAVLVGDLVHAEADALAAELPAPLRRIWRQLVVELTYGQLVDVVGTASRRRDVLYSRTAAMLKSGRYTIERPLELGAVAGGATPSTLGALATYGREIGLAFALRDDLLGVWGDPSSTGKPAGDDLVSGKPTMLLTLAHRRMRTAGDRALLRRVGGAAFDGADVAALQERMHAAGVAAEVERMISAHVATALGVLDDDAVDPAAATQLAAAARQIAWRAK